MTAVKAALGKLRDEDPLLAQLVEKLVEAVDRMGAAVDRLVASDRGARQEQKKWRAPRKSRSDQ